MVTDEKTRHPQPPPDHQQQVAWTGHGLGCVVGGDRPAERDAAERAHHPDRGFQLFSPDVVEIHVQTVGVKLRESLGE